MNIFFPRIKDFFSKYDKECIIALAVLLRMFGRGSATYGMVGEQYRDLIVVYRFLKLHQWPLLGPSSALGGFNFGAAYYYLLTPLVWLFGLAPYGGTLTSALFSVLSVWMIYRLLELWFGRKDAARLGTFFLAISVFDIQNSYYISNPNFLPFFILWFLYCLTFISMGRKEWKYFLGLALSFGIATQLHATALLLLPVVLIGALVLSRTKISLSRVFFILVTIIALYAPYIIYEFYNHLTNTRGLLHIGHSNYSFIIRPEAIIALVTFWVSFMICQTLFFTFFSLNPLISIAFLSLALIGGCASYVVYKRNNKSQKTFSFIRPGKTILGLLVLISIPMYVFFQWPLQPYYFLVLWPLPIIIVVWLIILLGQKNRQLSIILIILYCVAQMVQLFYFYPLVYQRNLSYSSLVSDFKLVTTKADGQSFNVFNGIMGVNQFLYYERVTGLFSSVTKAHAEKLFMLCSSEQESLCRLPELGYSENGLFYNNGITIATYQQ